MTGMFWNALEQLLVLRPINLDQITAHDHHNSGLTMRNYKTILKLYLQLLGIAK